MKFSFSLLFSGIFIAYVLNSIYSLVIIFSAPSCNDKYCLKSYLASKPKLQLLLATTTKPDLTTGSLNQLTIVDTWNPFDYSLTTSKNITIPLPRSTRRNGTLYLYAFVTEIPRHSSEDYKQSIQKSTTMIALFKLTQYLIPEAETFNLLKSGISTTTTSSLTNENKKHETGGGGKEKQSIAHITKNLKLTMMTDLYVLPRKELPPELSYMIRIITSDTYLPPLRFDKFSNRLRDFYRINSSETSFELELEFTSASIGNLRMGAQFEGAMDTMEAFGFSEKDLDEIKGIFSDTNAYLLGLTVFVASIHLLFDFLAFKNDVIYWKHRKSTEGLSSRTILWRCFSQIVIFVYLMEEKSSLLIIIPGGIGAVIEIWKVTKAFKIKFHISNGCPKISFGDSSESEKATAAHDVESMKYLSYLLYPLCICGAGYSLLYTPHKSWYSWTIQSLVNGVYAFGFLFMLPQLFVNYKLKSVAHLPWRAFMYKAFNTFIDDLFAFIITMPTAHRMACFRDDIVFLIYLYQRWLYPVDNTRIDAGGAYELEAEPSTVGESTETTIISKKTN